MRKFVLLIALAAAFAMAQAPAQAVKEKAAAASPAQAAKPAEAARPSRNSVRGERPGSVPSVSPELDRRIEEIVASGRVSLIGETSSSRLNPGARLAPGAPPILAFRYFDGQARQRFGDLDLVMDDAGH